MGGGNRGSWLKCKLVRTVQQAGVVGSASGLGWLWYCQVSVLAKGAPEHLTHFTRIGPPHPRAAYHAIACGADVNHSYSGQSAGQLVWEANMLAGGQAEQPLSPTNLGHTSVLHAACRVREGQRSAVDAARGGGRVFSKLFQS